MNTKPVVPQENLGPAPDFDSEAWLNAAGPLVADDLRGKVVLVEFWSYGCYNCQNVIPFVREWHQKYQAEGLVVVGVHYPEFKRERDVSNVRAAVEQLDVPYAVAIDNDGKNWKAFSTRWWPTRYLIDKQGDIRYKHVGEGAYEETEAYIRGLLAEPYADG